jgi:hypothetical protein
MPRGQLAPAGTERVAKNGYHYTKMDHPRAKNGWILTHWLTAEEMLGRSLRDDEMVKFKEPKWKRSPKDPAGIEIIKKRTTSQRRRLAQLEVRIAELTAERDSIKRDLGEL